MDEFSVSAKILMLAFSRMRFNLSKVESFKLCMVIISLTFYAFVLVLITLTYFEHHTSLERKKSYIFLLSVSRTSWPFALVVLKTFAVWSVFQLVHFVSNIFAPYCRVTIHTFLCIIFSFHSLTGWVPRRQKLRSSTPLVGAWLIKGSLFLSLELIRI